MNALTRTGLARRTELGLVILAAIITTGAYALASLGKSASLPANLGPFLVVILGLLGVAHFGVRRLAPHADGTLLPLAGLLNGIGYVFIARLDPGLAGLQAMWTAVGIAAFLATLAIVRRARDLDRYRYTVALGGIVLLLLPLAPGIGRTINGARLWLRVGPVSFQPGELAKVALVVFFASYLTEKGQLLSMATWRVGRLRLPDPRHYGPILLAWAISLLVMIAERDLGSSMLFFALFTTLLYVATARAGYVGLGFGLFAVGATVAWSRFSHVQERVQVWLDPWPTAASDGFQTIQAMYAFGSGGVTGAGLSLGSPNKIPAVTTDFIYAAIGEELGLLGTVAVLAAFVMMVGAGLRTAIRADHSFEKLLATGATAILGLQSFIILGGVTRLVPLTGITLPFVSYGGSSLVANYILLALLLRVSSDASIPRASR